MGKDEIRKRRTLRAQSFRTGKFVNMVEGGEVNSVCVGCLDFILLI